MTKEEALRMTTFKNYCTCGGFAGQNMSGQREEQPHMTWCPQFHEYAEYRQALGIPAGTSNADFLAGGPLS